MKPAYDFGTVEKQHLHITMPFRYEHQEEEK
jgi:hypothetical protein